jgi:chromosomal replication initiator protein
VDESAELVTIWNRARPRFDDPSIRPQQKAWIGLTRPLGLVEDTALLAAPNDFAKDYLENRLRPLIASVLSEELGRDIRVAVTVQSPEEQSEAIEAMAADDSDLADEDDWAADQSLAVAPAPNYRPKHSDDERGSRLNPKYTFDTFVIGSSNRFTHAAAVAVAEAPARAYNPLFIYGDSGLGKTHLLHAIGHYARRLQPNLRTRYISSEEFTNDFINSVRDDKMQAFQTR